MVIMTYIDSIEGAKYLHKQIPYLRKKRFTKQKLLTGPDQLSNYHVHP